jgi:hypothetical protein
MKPCLQSFLLSVGLACLLGAGPARAADSDPAAVLAKMVTVSAVNFSSAQASESNSGAWDEIDIEMSVQPTPTLQWADRVRVTLTLAFTVEGHAKTYRATAEAVALEVGSPNFRFYLPPEVIKEYKLKDTADFYAVEIAVGGVKLPLTKKNFSSSIDSPEKLKSLLASGSENNGILLPQYLSPFAHDPGKPTPTFMRPESGASGPSGASD